MPLTTRRQIVGGANGFVGANLVHGLLASSGQVIALARTPPRLVRQAVAEAVIGHGDVPMTGLRTLPWSLERPDLGLPARAVFAEPCDYWHVAAAVTFRPGDRARLWETNVAGTRRAVETFQRHAAPGSRFFLVSTAYTCGVADSDVAETWHPAAEPSQFRTYYEHSKREAERVFQQAGVPGAVLRLGQIVGDSVTGRASTSYGLYAYVRAISTLVRRRPHEQLRVLGDPATELHLVPVDACVRWMLTLADRDLDLLDPPVIHLVDRAAVPAERVAAAISTHLPVRFRIAEAAEFVGVPMTQVERLLEARVTHIGRYLNGSPRFRRDNLARLGVDEPATVTDDVLDRLISRYVQDLRRPKVEEVAG